MHGTLSAPAVALVGDELAASFGLLVERQLDGAYRLAAVILGDALEAEDAVGDASVAAWHGFGRLRDHGSFDAWFARILVNGCRDRLRRRRRVRIVDLGATLESLVAPRSGADVERRVAQSDAIARSMGRLDPDHQVVLVLRFWLDLPVEAIAGRLGIPLGTAKSRLHAAGRRLRDALVEEGDR